MSPRLRSSSLVVAVLAVVACGGGARDPVGADPFAAQRGVQAAPPPAPVVLAGVITSAESQVVAAEFEGRVEDVLVRGGQRVSAGQVLARLDDSQLRQRVESARQAANAARAEAARASIGVAEARRQLATEDRLYRSGAQSRQAVAAARASVSSSGAAAGAAFASARSSEAQVQELTEQLAKAEIKAPMDGVVTMIKVKPGEVAARGTRVARVFDPADLQVRFEVPRGHRAEFAVGAEVVVTLDGVERPLRATVIDLSADLEAPLQFAVGVADIDDAGLSPDDGRVGASASVRLAAAPARASAGR